MATEISFAGRFSVRHRKEPNMSRMGDTTEMGTNAGNQGEGQGQGQGGLTEKATQVTQSLKDMGQQAKQQATEQYEHLRGQAEDYYQQGKERAQEWEQSLESYVREKPVQSLMIAAGVGVVIGLLLKRA
jgi:ElaB/YqjD/DUF883 family membrane-anchored ribosome-binding protein